ncbi:MAG: hypothetical protein Q4G63_10460 [Bacteroidia bacterium]|nr:hypothetical protein [Bacteroidia bacterium]
MKKNVFISLLAVILLLGVTFGTTSCSSDNDIVANTKYEVFNNIKVSKDQWKWNENEKKYQAIVALPELTKSIYENGVQLAYLFIGQPGKDETQRMLPYVYTYYIKDANGNVIDKYTETISCDFQLGSPSTVAFFIQGSDLKRDDAYLNDYYFKVAFIWK